MNLLAHLLDFWRAFQTEAGTSDASFDERFYEAFYFGDSQALAERIHGFFRKG